MKPLPIVLGIDGGGTYTRVMAADLKGKVVGYAVGGSARLDRHSDAIQNVQTAIFQVLNQCQKSLADVACLVAGIAGLDSERDKVWARKLTQMSELVCPQNHVNDAVIAHAGALQSEPGMIVISGTGSIIYAVTDDDRHIRNYDMQHYANSGARHIAYGALFGLLANETTEMDQALCDRILDHFRTSTVGGLRNLVTHEGKGFTDVDWPMLGQLAPIITEAASSGSPLAIRVCNRACEEIVTGIRLLGGHFSEDAVSVSFIGSVIQSPYMAEETSRRLAESRMKTFRVVHPALTSTKGAVLMALEGAGVLVNDAVLTHLSAAAVDDAG